MQACSLLLLLLLLLLQQQQQAAATLPPPPDFCLSDSQGFITALAAPCPPGTSPFRGMGVNLFDIFWGAWGTGGATASLATSLAAVRDASMSGFRFARTFAVPFSYKDWGWAGDAASREAYWAAAGAVISEAERCGLKLIPSLGYGCPDSGSPCNPAAMLFNETYRDFLTNSSSLTRRALTAYAQDFVGRFKGSASVLFWELGNEMNLAADGCSYDKSPGAFFSTAEALAFLAEAAAAIKAVDPQRPVGSGMGSPRSRAKHLMETPGGGAACVSAANPKGDCEKCFNVPADSEADYSEVLQLYYGSSSGADMVSAHFYGCAPPYGNLSWCSDPGSTAPLAAFVSTAQALGKPLFLGEFGPSDGNWSDLPGRQVLAGMAEQSVQLSSLWAFECPSHDAGNMPAFCLHPGRASAQPYTEQVTALAQVADRQVRGLPPRAYNLSLIMLPPPAAPGSPACLDGSAYGYYALPGALSDKWLVMLQGGGWAFSLQDSFARTQPAYAGGNLGSSKGWQGWSWAYDFGPAFAGYSVLSLPYCDGASYSGSVEQPVPYNASISLFFRGAANLRAALADAVARFNISSPSEVLVTGGSAGGLSTMLHVDAIGAALGAPSGAAVGVPQAGWFPFWDAPCAGPTASGGMCNASGDFQGLFALQNTSGALSPQCKAEQGPGREWRCFMAAVAEPYVAAPLFVWQSKFDHFQLNEFLGADCAVQQAYNPPWLPAPNCSAANSAAIGAYGASFMQQLAPLLAAPGPHRGLYLTSCVLHGMDYNLLSLGEDAAGESGITPSVAFNAWHAAVRQPAGQAPSNSNGFKWVEDLPMPRVSNALACPPFLFAA
jgi:hypothetical protein